MEAVKDRVLKTIEENALLHGGEKIVVAVSGGADSVALLTLLAGMRKGLDLELVVAHFNHHLRAASSDGDETFTSSLAKAHGVPFRSAGADVGREARSRGASIEETAREMRYAFLVGCAGEVGAGKIALGHTADDLAETFLMRLLRGSGLGGLIPMEPMMERCGVPVIRPLLEVGHDPLVRYLKASGIPYRLDRSNFSSGYFRNRVRLELIPALETGYNPSVREVLVRTSRSLSVIRDFIDREIAGAYGRGVDEKGGVVYLSLDGLHPAVASGVVRLVLRRHGVPYSLHKIGGILAIAREGRGKVDLGRSFRAVVEGGRVVLQRGGSRVGKRLTVPITVPGRTVGEGVVVETSFVERARVKGNEPSLSQTWLRACDGEAVVFEAYLDHGSLEGPLVLRTRLPGDRFQPTGMRGTRKLKEIFIDEKVPERIRDTIPVVVAGEKLVWVVGYRVGEQFKVRPASEKILGIKVTVGG